MNRVLVIDDDRRTRQSLGLGCLDRDVAVDVAENLCEGVRVLLSRTVSLIAVGAHQLRLTPAEHVSLFERVAPGVPVVVMTAPGTALESRVALEVVGLTVISTPATPEDLLKALATATAVARDLARCTLESSSVGAGPRLRELSLPSGA